MCGTMFLSLLVVYLNSIVKCHAIHLRGLTTNNYLGLNMGDTSVEHQQSVYSKRNLLQLIQAINSTIFYNQKGILIQQLNISQVCQNTELADRVEASQKYAQLSIQIYNKSQLLTSRKARNAIVGLYMVGRVLNSTNCSFVPQQNKTKTIMISNMKIENENWVYGYLGAEFYFHQQVSRLIYYNSHEQCPEDYPFSNGRFCLVCNYTKNEHFDMSTQKCERCYFGYKINKTSHACQKMDQVYVTNPFATNLLVNNAEQYLNNQSKILREYEGAQLCPLSNIPFGTSQGCIGCSGYAGNYFDVSKQECSHCRGTVNNFTLTCIPNPPSFSNPDAYGRILNWMTYVAGQEANPCPVATPFFDRASQKCVQCQGQMNLFNAELSKCTQCQSNQRLGYDRYGVLHCFPNCPNGSYYNANTRVCQGVCAPSFVYDIYSGKCVLFDELTPAPIPCPPHTKFNSGSGVCEPDCPPNTRLNELNFECQPQCPKDTTYNVSTSQCEANHRVANQSNANTTSQNANATSSNDSNDTTPQNNNTVSSTDNASQNTLNNNNNTVPTYNTITNNITEPTKCPNNTHPDSAGECSHSCPEGTIYNQLNSQCVTQCPENTTLNSQTNVCTFQCPQNSLYLKYNQTCIDECPPNTLYNGLQQRCEPNCSQGTIYDSVTAECVDLPPLSNLNAGDWVADLPYQTVKEHDTNLATNQFALCPSQTPYVVNGQCSDCPVQHPVYNSDTRICQSCQLGSSYSDALHKCEKQKLQGLTNIYQAPNLLLSDVSIGQWQSEYNTTKEQHPELVDCPAETPYFDGTKCRNCPQEYGYFDLYHKDCMKCQGSSVYEPETKQCIDESGQPLSPNLQNLMANVFAHQKSVNKKQGQGKGKQKIHNLHAQNELLRAKNHKLSASHY